jgi:hypothetical protein
MQCLCELRVLKVIFMFFKFIYFLCFQNHLSKKEKLCLSLPLYER